MISVPVIETERLRLRALGPQDIEAYVTFFASDRSRFIGGPRPRRDAWRTLATLIGHWQLRGWGPWAVADKSDDRILGTIGPWCPEGWPEPEMSWSVHDAAEGRGIAFEAAKAALNHAFTSFGWSTAVSYIDPENTRSIRLAERLGARPDPDADHPDFDGKPCLVYRHPAPEARS
ncbi:MAG: GNAT family N-acetyltransferase [Pseudomonadota bacterium]